MGQWQGRGCPRVGDDPLGRGPEAQDAVLLRDGTTHDLGPRSFDGRDRQAVERRLVRPLERLGYQMSPDRGAA